MRAAHDRAVAAAINYLGAEAGLGLRGHHGGPQAARTVTTGGFLGAAFQHRANRCGDPQLHTHVVVGNLVRGRRTGLGAGLPVPVRRGKTAGYLYQAVLRHELSSVLAVQWTPVRRGVGEVAGVRPGCVGCFSKRREQIEALLALSGATDAKAAQQATWGDPARQGPRRHRRPRGGSGRLHGHDPALVTGVVHRVGPARDLHPLELADLVAELAGPAGLTLHHSAFDRREVLRAVCAALPAGVSPTRLQDYTAAVVSDGAVVPLQGEARPGASEAGRCYSELGGRLAFGDGVEVHVAGEPLGWAPLTLGCFGGISMVFSQ